jgi:hypothetical protein
VLVERQEVARGGGEVVAVKLRSAMRESTQMPPVLDAWLTVRDWVKRCLPAQVAEAIEPLDALGRLRDGLGVLEERLTCQEADLRGASEDVARGIEVHLRKAKNQVRRLNQNLEGVTFGSIKGIRVQMRRVERMDRVLRVARGGRPGASVPAEFTHRRGAQRGLPALRRPAREARPGRRWRRGAREWAAHRRAFGEPAFMIVCTTTRLRTGSPRLTRR